MMEILQTLLKISLVIFMAGSLLDMGLRLKVSEALRALRDVRFVVVSLLWGFVALPALAYAIAEWLPMAHPFAMGLILLGMAPSSPFMPPMVERARGDMGLAAAFMLLASAVTVAYMPFGLPLLVKGLSASALTIAKPLVLFVLLPLAIGLALQHRSAALAERLDPVVRKASGINTMLMLLLCVLVYGKEFLELVGSHAIGAQVLLFAASTVGPYALGFGLPREQRVVMSIGMATRNVGAALAPLFAIPGMDERAIVMVAFGVVMQTAFSLGAASYFRRAAEASGAPRTTG